jgi:hypothetical protein
MQSGEESFRDGRSHVFLARATHSQGHRRPRRGGQGGGVPRDSPLASPPAFAWLGVAHVPPRRASWGRAGSARDKCRGTSAIRSSGAREPPSPGRVAPRSAAGHCFCATSPPGSRFRRALFLAVRLPRAEPPAPREWPRPGAPCHRGVAGPASTSAARDEASRPGHNPQMRRGDPLWCGTEMFYPVDKENDMDARRNEENVFERKGGKRLHWSLGS